MVHSLPAVRYSLGRHHDAARHGMAWHVSLGFPGLFDDFTFYVVPTVDIEALLEGFLRRLYGLVTIDDKVAMDFQNVCSFKNV
jgi:hypothetical protein